MSQWLLRACPLQMSVQQEPRRDWSPTKGDRMTVTLIEVDPTPTEDDDEPAHISCHCTSYLIAWCGERLDDAELVDDVDTPTCPLCGLVFDELDASRLCPWGCPCGECSGCGCEECGA